MTSNTLVPSLLFVSLLSLIALLGCQTNSLDHTAQTRAVIDDKNWSATTLKPRLFQTATKYEWQLTHVSDDKDKLIPVTAQTPLKMDIRPNRLTFDDGCYQYRVSFNIWLSTPYPYTDTKLQDTVKSPNSPANCITMYEITTKDRRGNTVVHSNTARLLDHFFKLDWYITANFKLEPQLSKSGFMNGNIEKQLALKTNTGKTLVFTGSPKPKHAVAGMPITNSLLEHYRWHLIKVTDKTGTAISDFIQTERPIVASYDLNNHKSGENDKQDKLESDIYDQTIAIYGGCDIVMGSYVLSVNQTLVTGGFPAIMTGCSEARNNIEKHLRRMMLYSTSQLILTYTNNAKPLTKQSEPNYLLTQKLESGEILVWQSEDKRKKYFKKF